MHRQQEVLLAAQGLAAAERQEPQPEAVPSALPAEGVEAAVRPSVVGVAAQLSVLRAAAEVRAVAVRPPEAAVAVARLSEPRAAVVAAAEAERAAGARQQAAEVVAQPWVALAAQGEVRREAVPLWAAQRAVAPSATVAAPSAVASAGRRVRPLQAGRPAQE